MSAWGTALEHHFGSPRGATLTTWRKISVLTEDGYTTADCDTCKETVASDADPAVVAQALDSHFCDNE